MEKEASMRNSYKAGSGSQNLSDDSQDWVITRRMFLKSTAASLAGLAVLPLSCALEGISSTKLGTVRFGIVTDCHYADADTMGTRFYRESLDKLTECVALMNTEKVDFLIELGDFKDQNGPPVVRKDSQGEQRTLSYLQVAEKVLQGFDGPTYHVLGNHDMDSISKRQFLRRVENTNIDSSRSYYSFAQQRWVPNKTRRWRVNALRCVVLDANYKADGTDYEHGNFDWTDTNIPSEELDWLKQDLAAPGGPVIVFIHQLLDGIGSVYVNNAADVRQILQASGKVLAVFQGHHHSGSYSNIAGIHYYTLKALVEGSGPENNSYAIAEVHPDSSITITGYRQAVSKQLTLSLAIPNG